MGYSYGMAPSGRWALACDSCGEVGAVRKRTCPHKVTSDSTRGPRYALPYCPAPALCGPCFQRHGRTKGLHDRCAEGAAAAQAKYDETEARFQSGEGVVVAAWGDWDAETPSGMVRFRCIFATREERDYLVPDEDYPTGDGFLGDYPRAVAI
jgi:hypothetical protein